MHPNRIQWTNLLWMACQRAQVIGRLQSLVEQQQERLLVSRLFLGAFSELAAPQDTSLHMLQLIMNYMLVLTYSNNSIMLIWTIFSDKVMVIWVCGAYSVWYTSANELILLQVCGLRSGSASISPYWHVTEPMGRNTAVHHQSLWALCQQCVKFNLIM